jgi:D-beta-D-heptose 7-phosphate kinase/D-beta-D-heptose 1-phosphate adenosyltransferase
MDSSAVDTFLSHVGSLRVLVVGDLMLDEYIWGRAGRISPEAPVPVVVVKSDDLRLGGAGNVAVNLLAMGCQVKVASVVGDDEDGRSLGHVMGRMALSFDNVVLDDKRQTTRKTRILASNQQMLRIDRESRAELSTDIENELICKVESCAVDVDAILISDYLKGVLTDRMLETIIDLAKKRSIPVIVDPKGSNFSKYRNATLLTPNIKEAELATGLEIRDMDSLLAAGQKLLIENQLESLIITRSEEGMSIFTENGVTHIPTNAKEVFDVTGAGDTVLALLGIGLAAGLNVVDAAWLANIAAGVVVGKVGTSTVNPAELNDAILLQQTFTDRTIQTAESIERILEKKRAEGQTIVFTNGCFDLLHAGHVRYLQKARQLGNLLVLGLNSDASVRRLKGEKRPLLDQGERAHILAALECVDFLVIFDEDTPLELIKKVRPDILSKGGDYLPDEVVGKDYVESYGGRVELVQFVEGKSTTGIIEKILSKYQDE